MSSKLPPMDPRVESFLEAKADRPKTELSNGYKITEMPGFDPKEPMSAQDRYHMYTGVGLNASNTNHHHKFGDVTIFFSETSPTNFHGDSNKGRRYLIIADQWTGKRIQVFLPDYYENVPDKPSVGDILYDKEGREAEVVEIKEKSLICQIEGIKLPYGFAEIYFDTKKSRWTTKGSSEHEDSILVD